MNPKGVSATDASALTDRFRDELFILGQHSGQYRVMERGLMEDIMKEQNFQLFGCTSDECAVEVGKIVGVKQIIDGSISKVGDVYSVLISIISMEPGLCRALKVSGSWAVNPDGQHYLIEKMSSLGFFA